MHVMMSLLIGFALLLLPTSLFSQEVPFHLDVDRTKFETIGDGFEINLRIENRSDSAYINIESIKLELPAALVHKKRSRVIEFEKIKFDLNPGAGAELSTVRLEKLSFSESLSFLFYHQTPQTGSLIIDYKDIERPKISTYRKVLEFNPLGTWWSVAFGWLFGRLCHYSAGPSQKTARSSGRD